MTWIGRIFFHGFTKPVDMDRHGGRISQGIKAPDARIKGFPAEYDIRMFHQEFKELEFLVRKFLFLAVDPDSSRIRFQHDVAERDALCFLLRPLDVHTAPAAP